MARFLDTRGASILAIAVCDRCGFKRRYVDLRPDPNTPGLRVCRTCADQFDPWRLPAPAPDKISLEFPRPDVSLVPDSLLVQDDGISLIAWNDGVSSGGIKVSP